MSASELSPIKGDIVVDCSCGHDSGFLVVMRSGLVYNKICSGAPSCPWHEISEFFQPLLRRGERAIVSLGSQANKSAVVTNHDRCIIWHSSALARYVMFLNKDVAETPVETVLGLSTINPASYFGIIKPRDGKTGERLQFVKHKFGHNNFFLIDSKKRLYHNSLNSWLQVKGTEGLKVVDVDSGSRHEGLVTEDGEVYTWGCNAHGNLAHNDFNDRPHPTRVDWIKENGYKAVAIGCGGWIAWSGGFTLILLDDNRLFCCGNLGEISKSPIPVQIGKEELAGRHILSISAGEDWAGIVASKPSYTPA